MRLPVNMKGLAESRGTRCLEVYSGVGGKGLVWEWGIQSCRARCGNGLFVMLV